MAKSSNDPSFNVWGIHAGKTGDANTLFFEKNCIAIGWPSVGDLSKIQANRDAFAKQIKTAYPTMKPGAIAINTGQIFRFIHEIKKGDIVVYPSKTDKLIHIGRIEGEYHYDPKRDANYPNQRPVKWLKPLSRTAFTQGALYETGAAMSLFLIKNYSDEFTAAIENTQPPTPPPVDEAFELISGEIEQATADFIIKQLAQQTKGHPFAQFVAHLLQTIGYHTRISPEGPDHGIDIIAHRDELGIQPPIVKVQCKSTEGSINEETVSAFFGRITEKEFGLFVTLGTYNKGAENYARGRTNLRLIDGEELVGLVLEHYEKFDSRFKGTLPLKRVYIPEPIERAEE
jgi:restriction system protein